MPTARKFVKYLGWTLALLLLLGISARISLAPLTRWAINDWFAQQGIVSRVADVNFEIPAGRFELLGLAADADGQPVLALDRLATAWSWSDLWHNRLRIDSLRIDGLEVDVARFDDGRMTVAGIDPAAGTAPGETAATAQPAEPPDWTLQLAGFEMADTRLCYRGPPQLDYCNTLANLQWHGNLQFELANLDAEALPLRADGDLRLAGFESRNNELQRVLANFEQFAFEGIAIDTSDDIAIAAVSLEALNLFERFGDRDGEFIEHIDRLRVNELRLDGTSLLTVAEVLIEGNATEFVKAEAERYEIDTWLAALGQAPEASGESSAAPQASDGNGRSAAETAAPTAQPAVDPKPRSPAAFEFTLGKLIFESEKPLYYRDLSLGKPFAVGLSSTRLVVESLDSRQPGQPSELSYEARLDGDSLFEIAGSITPLAPKISFDLAGEIRALDLRQLSPLTAANIGYTIRSGQLDADIELQAEQTIMDGKIELILYRFDLQALSDADAEAMEARFGFPLGTGLALLKNREGNIELKVPLSGDLQNPDFGTGEIVTRELSKAITSAVLTFYTPFGLITAADALFSLATALEFEPVTFASGESELDAARRGELDKIATLMRERPGIQLRLCPYTNTADRLALYPDTSNIAPEDIVVGDLPGLGELGEARMLSVENYLEGKDIDPARLIPCASTHQAGEGLAGVEISI